MNTEGMRKVSLVLEHDIERGEIIEGAFLTGGWDKGTRWNGYPDYVVTRDEWARIEERLREWGEEWPLGEPEVNHTVPIDADGHMDLGGGAFQHPTENSGSH